MVSRLDVWKVAIALLRSGAADKKALNGLLRDLDLQARSPWNSTVDEGREWVQNMHRWRLSVWRERIRARSEGNWFIFFSSSFLLGLYSVVKSGRSRRRYRG